MARQMVTQYGMSDVLGPATFETAPAPLYLPEGAVQRRGDYSERTAETHVDHILTKLDFAGRAQIAAWVASNAGNVTHS